MHRLAIVAALATPRPAARFLSLLACTAAVPMCLVGAQSTVTSSSDTIPARLLQFGIGGGFAKTSENPLSRTTHGFNLQATIALRTPLRPLRLRFDGLLSDAGATQVQALTASAVLSAPARRAATPYVLAGGGGYAENSGRTTVGWNLGVGFSVRTGRQTLFMESRVHAYRDALSGQPYVVPNGVVANRHNKYTYLWHPLSFGFRF